MKRRYIILGIIILVVLLSIFRIVEYITKTSAMKKLNKESKDFVFTVKVKEAKIEKIFDRTNFVGEIKGINEVSVVPKVTGKIVRKIVEEGSEVKKDDVICEIDRDEPVLKYSLYEVKSPISGVLVKYFVDTGAMVSPQTPLSIVSDNTNVKIVFNLAEKLVSKIRPGSYIRFTTSATSNKVFISKDIQLNNYIDPVSRTMEIKSVLPNPDKIFRSGSFVNGEIIFLEKYSVVVPAESVSTTDGNKYVYVVEDGVAKKRFVEVGITDKDKTEILSGIKPKEKVVFQGYEMLTDGVKVNIIEE
jgi:multidrug efflux pump subunit AcrA (membrane-fusion protein)